MAEREVLAIVSKRESYAVEKKRKLHISNLPVSLITTANNGKSAANVGAKYVTWFYVFLILGIELA